MLVLSRKIGEQILIDGNIVVTVNRIDGNRVSLGIEAPRDVRIVRQELCPFGQEPVPAPVGRTFASPAPAFSR